MVLCTNKECPKYRNELTNNDISSEEIVDTFYKDLDNGEEYSEGVPSGHSYDEYNIKVTSYECPECGTEVESEEETIFIRTVTRD
jgi:hypothetical protein